MMIRSFSPLDYAETRRIHTKHFGDEFEFPDFLSGFHCAFVIESGYETVVVGGVRPIAELIAITNKDMSPKLRVKALKELTRAGMLTCGLHGYPQLHCFVQGDKWQRQVQTVGFRPTVGKSLVLDIPGHENG